MTEKKQKPPEYMHGSFPVTVDTEARLRAAGFAPVLRWVKGFAKKAFTTSEACAELDAKAKHAAAREAAK